MTTELWLSRQPGNLQSSIFNVDQWRNRRSLPASLIACVAALCATVLLLRRSILTEKLAGRGQHVAREYSVDLFELMRVQDVMDTQVPSVPAEWTVARLSRRISDGDPSVATRQGTLIFNRAGMLAGIITRGDIVRALQADPRGGITVLEAGRTDVVVSYPDEPLHDAIAKMLKRDVGRLPVVLREDERKVVGYIGRGDILAARLRHHEEEEVREPGPLLAWRS